MPRRKRVRQSKRDVDLAMDIIQGTTTAEAKSGYGLDKECELKQLRAIRRASESSPVRLVPTCLAAHEFPPESRGSDAARAGYVSTILAEILPAVAEEKLAVFCDAFVERGVFTRDQGEAVLRAGVIDGQHLGVFAAQPDGRGRGGRAEDHLHLALGGHLDALVQPVEVDLARARLHREPRELAHVDDLKAHRLHVVKVALPLIARPLFGVVVGADLHSTFPVIVDCRIAECIGDGSERRACGRT